MNIFWFRRDLRLNDNVGLAAALSAEEPVQCLFIFDTNIIDELDRNDARITFIYQQLEDLQSALQALGSSLMVKIGAPHAVWENLVETYSISKVFLNKDYEPYARSRDNQVYSSLKKKGVDVLGYKDQVIMGPEEILKKDFLPYTIYTPYKNKWFSVVTEAALTPISSYPRARQLVQSKHVLPSLHEIGFTTSNIQVLPFQVEDLADYDEKRNYPAQQATSYLGPHLRFGTIGIRTLYAKLWDVNKVFIQELIWREFFMQILFHYPTVVDQCFKPKYENIEWRNNRDEFEKWCQGATGYPMVDAGMRELNATGYLHNRVRMVTASFLCKHLLIDWRWGEAYFAEKLLDYDLSANNGNWQWAAGTGCDAAPYFRVFNPTTQLAKFDKELVYTKKWVPEWDALNYQPMVDHAFARQRALRVYKEGLEKTPTNL